MRSPFSRSLAQNRNVDDFFFLMQNRKTVVNKMHNELRKILGARSIMVYIVTWMRAYAEYMNFRHMETGRTRFAANIHSQLQAKGLSYYDTLRLEMSPSRGGVACY